MILLVQAEVHDPRGEQDEPGRNDGTQLRREREFMIDWEGRVDKTERDERARRDWNCDTECGRQQRQKADAPETAHVFGRVDRAGGQIAE